MEGEKKRGREKGEKRKLYSSQVKQNNAHSNNQSQNTRQRDRLLHSHPTLTLTPYAKTHKKKQIECKMYKHTNKREKGIKPKLKIKNSTKKQIIEKKVNCARSTTEAQGEKQKGY